jgi:hypothetical protein
MVRWMASWSKQWQQQSKVLADYCVNYAMSQ